MLYVAYGSNISKEQMKFRCPSAKAVGKGVINNWQLDFHGTDGSAYATIVQAAGSQVPVVLWEMSAAEEKIMDRYEGFPTAYYKKKIAVYVGDQKKFGIVYIMNPERKVGRPSRKYVNTIRRGYEDFKLDMKFFEDALVRNSRDFYLDDTIEVREFKPEVKEPKIPASAKKGKKAKVKANGKKKKAGPLSNIQDLQIWKSAYSDLSFKPNPENYYVNGNW